ncbi:MAG: FAD-binding oxidoreductase [Deltaproteobacteria bacterium]|nr:MAG: FAD-binding oxidoreductase [Deltaproteobacteria bacterium]
MKVESKTMEVLKDMLKAEWVKSDPETLSAHAVDDLTPRAVAFPESLAQVSQVVKMAQKEKWAVVPWGSGSKIGVGNPPSRLHLVISTNRLNKIIDMDTANLTVTAQAGVKFRDLQTSLAGEENRCYLPYESPTTVSDEPVCADREHMGCFIPMMPPFSHSATLGGIIAANSSGPVRLLYGLPRDMVLGVRYVAADGEIVGLGGKTVKNVSGYDMCKLMIGSRGSLGILGEMTIRLLPLPERFGTCLLGFSGLDAASRFVDQIFQTRLLPSAVELLNGRANGLLVEDGALEMDGDGYVVAVGLEGFGEAVQRMGREIEEMASASGAQNYVHLADDPDRIFWDAYSNLVPKLSAGYPGMVSVKLNYPISRYLDVIQSVDSLCGEQEVAHALQAHTGSGVSRVHCLLGSGDDKSADRVVSVAEKLLEKCQSIGGNLLVEKASAQMKERLPVWGMPPQDFVIMKRIKAQMDPSGLFSPGRFVGGI